MNYLVFVVLPFGIGNEYAENFGLYSYIKMIFIKDNLYPMVDLVHGILTSKVTNFNVWNIKVEIYDNDTSFLQVSPYNQDTAKLKMPKQRCLNYLSFGEGFKVRIAVETYRKCTT